MLVGWFHPACDIQKAIRGESVMNTELEAMGNPLLVKKPCRPTGWQGVVEADAMFSNQVPKNWSSVAYNPDTNVEVVVIYRMYGLLWD